MSLEVGASALGTTAEQAVTEANSISVLPLPTPTPCPAPVHVPTKGFITSPPKLVEDFSGYQCLFYLANQVGTSQAVKAFGNSS